MGIEQMMDRFSFPGLLRVPGDGRARVTYVELFFDLVYVFAVTQLSHHLIEHLSLHGAAQTFLLLSAVWTVWIYTAWFTNWLDPDKRAVRLVLIAVMLASLIMSAVLPDAFGDQGLTFAAAFVAMQVGRSAFVIAAAAEQPVLRRNFHRIVCWAVFSGVFWIAGGLAHDRARELLWLTAVLIDYAAPICGFYAFRLGRSSTHEWQISGSHLAERCQLFLIVALGESILVTGATFGELEHTAPVVAALVVAFLGSVALWWVYFDRSAEAAGAVIAAMSDPGRLGRSGYTYFHIPMVAGIIVAAVGDELTIAHPTGHASTATIATVVGGPALFLAGHMLFKSVAFGHFSTSRPVALVALAVLAIVGSELSPLLLSSSALLILGGVIYADTRYNRTVSVPGIRNVEEPVEERFALEGD
jgi:low temperature requirement protein LtrA